MKNLGFFAFSAVLVVVYLFPQQVFSAGFDITLEIPEVREDRNTETILLDGYGFLREVGAPRLPARIHAIAIPPGAVFQSVMATSDRSSTIENVSVTPAIPPRAISDHTIEMDPMVQKAFETNRQRIYSSDTLYPAQIATAVGTGGFRKYNLVNIRVCPIQYSPVSKTLTVHQRITLTINYILPEAPVELIRDHSRPMEQRARDILSNYEQAQAWYPEIDSIRGLHDYVIVTTSDLTGAVDPLVQWETIKGRNVEVVTTDWIYSSYTGYDSAEKIRNFLRDKYPTEQWGIEDICFVGTLNNVPMRHISDDPDTDFYYAELSLPDNQSWDSNGNHSYLDSGDSCDFYAEVNVGRIPWSDSATVMAICEKSVNYEMNDDPTYKQNMLLLGAYFWSDTDNAVLMEAKVDQPWMVDWTMTRMYEQNADFYSSYPCDQELLRANAVTEWSNGTYAFVNYAGHGSATACHIYGIGAPEFIDATDCTSLSDTYPAIVFADACSNSDTQEISIGARMLEHGAVGFVGATRVAYGCPGWTGPLSGSSQSLDYFFTTGVTSGEYTQGASHQYALTEVYQMNGWDFTALEMCEWTLYGNPNLGMTQVNSSDGRIFMDADNYGVNRPVIISVRDLDLNLDPVQLDSVSVTIETSAGDTETLTLYEISANSAVFEGTIELVSGAPDSGNNLVDGDDGQTITATYIDADDGIGGVNVPKTDTAQIDFQNPIIFNIYLDSVTHESATITWHTDEPATSRITYGESTPGITQIMESLNMTHTMTITDLADCTRFNYYLESTDEAGNTCVANNDGAFYQLTTWELVTMLDETMDTDPGWITEDLWEWGQPTGQGGQYGSPDPTSGYTGNTIYGYNLNGDYGSLSSTRYLETHAFDCSETTHVEFSYYAWLGVESAQYDHASIDISVDNGSSWTNFWSNNATLNGGSWEYYAFDISSIVAGYSQVKIRWGIGPTDSVWHYCGWNIDDVLISYTRECEGLCVNDGDVDFNGTVTAGDAQIAFMVALGSHTPTFEEECAADCNGDGEVTAGDAQAVFLKALGSGACVD